MLLKMFKMNKRINSTKLPTNDDLLISGEVTLKGVTSVDKPVFIMACEADDMSYARICNYAEFQGNYFWITELRQLNNTHIEISCEVDVLATFKTDILGTKAYVLYSDSAGRTDLIDNRNVRTINWKYRKTIREKVSMFTKGESCYIVEVINGNPSTKLSTSSFYLMSSSQMEALMSSLYGSNDFFDNIVKSIQNPSNLMVKAIWYPFGISEFQGAFTGQEEPVKVGNYEAGANGYRIQNIDFSSTAELIHIDLSAALQDNYAYDESNCTLKCTLPFYGMIELPVSTTLKAGTREFFIRITLDILSGTLMYEILGSAGEAGYRTRIYRTNFGCTVPLGYQSYNPLQFIGTVTSAVGGVAAAAMAPEAMMPSMMTSAIGFGAGNVISSISSLQKDNGVIGTIGSRVDMAWANDITVEVLTAELSESVTAKKEVLGLPCCSTVELSTLTGYCQCSNASVSAIAMPEEIIKINNYLNGGMYIE